MKFNIESNESGIDIDVSEAEGEQKKLLEAFQECQEGHCSCPTQEYSKLESLVIENDADKIHLKLKSKQGEQIDAAEIAKCLEYTKAKVSEEK